MTTDTLSPRTTPTPPTPPSSRPSTSPWRDGVRRTRALSGANVRLMRRNRLTTLYAFVVPLTPLVLIAFADGSTAAAAAGAGSVLLLALVFPVYYTVLSMLVTRRDELVLKRLRTGEVRDREVVASLALPGTVVAAVVMAVAVAIGLPTGLPFPTNLPLYVVTVLAGAGMFTAFALWTASFTRTAENAQITSMPVILLASAGTLAPSLPDRAAEVLSWTPMAALDTLQRVAWFGLDTDGGSVGFAGSWAEAGQPLVVLAVWSVLAVDLARRTMRWEPRS
ncbi:MAG: ABC transporter permease [Nocardioides sp.]|nr:ABC transporter permease [Nocardioides sp.]